MQNHNTLHVLDILVIYSIYIENTAIPISSVYMFIPDNKIWSKKHNIIMQKQMNIICHKGGFTDVIHNSLTYHAQHYSSMRSKQIIQLILASQSRDYRLF